MRAHVVLGLGNPGERYERTRHNAGWSVLEEVGSRWSPRELERHPEYRASMAEVRDRIAVLMAPLTYMNRAGEALHAWRSRHGEPESLLVVTDDVYLPLGRLRLRGHGSSGGHRGLESIEHELGHRDYARLRVGVGATESSELRRHVLEPLDSELAAGWEQAIRSAADAVECWLLEGLLVAMNRFNRKVPKEVSEP